MVAGRYVGLEFSCLQEISWNSSWKNPSAMVQARGSKVLAEETLWSVSYAGSKDQLQPGQAEQKLNQEVEEGFLLLRGSYNATSAIPCLAFSPLWHKEDVIESWQTAMRMVRSVSTLPCLFSRTGEVCKVDNRPLVVVDAAAEMA